MLKTGSMWRGPVIDSTLTSTEIVQSICSQGDGGADRVLTWPSVRSHVIDVWPLRRNCSGFIVTWFGLGLCCLLSLWEGAFQLSLHLIFHHIYIKKYITSCHLCIRITDIQSFCATILWVILIRSHHSLSCWSWGHSSHPVQTHGCPWLRLYCFFLLWYGSKHTPSSV